jgi:hypothetical protein
MKEREVEEGSPLFQAAAFEGLAENEAYNHEDRLAFALTANKWLHRALDEADDKIKETRDGN